MKKDIMTVRANANGNFAVFLSIIVLKLNMQISPALVILPACHINKIMGKL
jgi:hypothetical protein